MAKGTEMRKFYLIAALVLLLLVTLVIMGCLLNAAGYMERGDALAGEQR